MSTTKRFFDKVMVDLVSDCWLWTACTDRDGYGRFSVGARTVEAHRWAYQRIVGPITDETLDHLCTVKRCVNPEHLEPVSFEVNARRGNLANGHRYRAEHGTCSMYANQRCRCESCKAAMSAYLRDYRARAREAPSSQMPIFPEVTP